MVDKERTSRRPCRATGGVNARSRTMPTTNPAANGANGATSMMVVNHRMRKSSTQFPPSTNRVRTNPCRPAETRKPSPAVIGATMPLFSIRRRPSEGREASWGSEPAATSERPPVSFSSLTRSRMIEDQRLVGRDVGARRAPGLRPRDRFIHASMVPAARPITRKQMMNPSTSRRRRRASADSDRLRFRCTIPTSSARGPPRRRPVSDPHPDAYDTTGFCRRPVCGSNGLESRNPDW